MSKCHTLFGGPIVDIVGFEEKVVVEMEVVIDSLGVALEACHFTQSLGKGSGLTTREKFIYGLWMVDSLSSVLSGLGQVGNELPCLLCRPIL